MPSLTADARQQATWLWQSMQNHQMALWYDNWVKKNHGVDPLHRDHSINCTAVAVLHLPALPPFPGHVSLIHAIQTIGHVLMLCNYVMRICFGGFMLFLT